MGIVDSVREVYYIFKKYNEINNLSGDNYNLFRVIDMASNEVKVHSAFISNLLDSKANHGFGTTFLKLFLYQLQIEGFDVNSAQVKSEVYIGEVTETTGGQIDIDVWDKNGYHIIIENKIYADDQLNQLVRYHSYGKQQCKKFCLLYLTLGGEGPDVGKSCTNSETKEVLQEMEDYSCLSYALDILNWLELCREKATNKPLVREGISHYINLVKFLTNDTMNDEMKKEVKAELLKNSNIEFLYLLKESISTVEDELELKFWNKLTNKLELCGYKIQYANYEKGVIDYRTSPRGNKYYGFEIEINPIHNLFYGIRMDNSLYGGFTIRIGNDNEQNLADEFSQYRDLIQKVDSLYKANKWWLGWKWIECPFSFSNINEYYCHKMAHMDDFVNSIFEGVDRDIKVFKELV